MEESPIECSACAAEPDIDIDTNTQIMKGWKLDGEFGPTCPECSGETEVGEAADGLDGVFEALGATKKAEPTPAPVGIEFSQQVNPGPFLGGCVDYEGPIPTEPYVPEEPKPDVMVPLLPKKEE